MEIWFEKAKMIYFWDALEKKNTWRSWEKLMKESVELTKEEERCVG